MHWLDLIVIPAGLVAGFIDTLAGGGGMITLPTYLMLGMPVHVAIGTNKLSATMGITNATRIFIKKRIIQPKFWLAAIAACCVGSILGACLVHLIHAGWLKKFLPFVMLLLLIYSAWPKHYRKNNKKNVKPSKRSSSLISGVIGFYDGLIGPGAGSFFVVALSAFYQMDLIEATGVAKLLNFISNLTALLVFISFGTVDYRLAILMGVAMMTGAYFGAHSAIRFGVKFVRIAFILIVFCLTIALFWRNWLS